MQNFISAKVPLYGLNNYIEINLGEDKINLKECLEILYSKRLRDAAENVLRGNELNTS